MIRNQQTIISDYNIFIHQTISLETQKHTDTFTNILFPTAHQKIIKTKIKHFFRISKQKKESPHFNQLLSKNYYFKKTLTHDKLSHHTFWNF